MRICIARSNQINPDSRVEKEANSLIKAGHKVTLFGWDRGSNHAIRTDSKKLTDAEVNRVCIGAKAEFGAGMKSIISYMKFQIALFTWIVKNRASFDIFHFCDFDTAFVGAIACRLIRKKFIFDIFDYLSTDADTVIKKIIERLENGIINRADATIICSEKRKEQIKKANPKNLTVIHNSPPQYPIETIHEQSGDAVKLVYVGILQDYRLLKELLHVVSEDKSLELHIAGFGKYVGLVEKYAAENSNVIYYGSIAYDQTILLEEKCDVMTAIYDPTIGNHRYAAPNKFYEGLLLGKPLIMVKGTGMSEYISEYNIGVLIDYSEESLKAGIKEIYDRKHEWAIMSSRMKNIYETEFSWGEMEKRLTKLYLKVQKG